MKNFVQDGKTIEVKVTGSAIKSGEVRMIEDVAAVAVTDGAVGDTVVMHTSGVFEVPKVSGAIKQGQKVYANGNSVAASETDAKFAGYAWEAAAAAAPTVLVKLNA